MLQQNGSYIEGAGGTLEIVAARKKAARFLWGNHHHTFFNIMDTAKFLIIFLI
jgi:hypothetical protein